MADYITFIHAGKIVFSKTKDDILEQYGVVKCEKARAAALDGAHIGPARQQIRRRAAGGQPARSGPPVPRRRTLEQATIDDIMTFFAKGAYDA